jgi:hypothetical protein
MKTELGRKRQAERMEAILKADGFKQGSGCFVCKQCGKLTRKTNHHNVSQYHNCDTCFDFDTDENSVSDGYMTTEEYNKKWAEHMIKIEAYQSSKK